MSQAGIKWREAVIFALVCCSFFLATHFSLQEEVVRNIQKLLLDPPEQTSRAFRSFGSTSFEEVDSIGQR